MQALPPSRKPRVSEWVGAIGRCAAVVLLAIYATAQADEMDMRDFIRLQRGMTQAEVLYRVGQPDYRDTCFNCNGVVSAYGYYPYSLPGFGCNGGFGCGPAYPAFAPMQAWYYIPQYGSSNAWITEIVFDPTGRVMRLNRDRPVP